MIEASISDSTWSYATKSGIGKTQLQPRQSAKKLLRVGCCSMMSQSDQYSQLLFLKTIVLCDGLSSHAVAEATIRKIERAGLGPLLYGSQGVEERFC
jgi:hypothetical protein